MYFPDMSVNLYDCFWGRDNPIPIPSVRMVGWLEYPHEYTKGKVDETILQKLEELFKTRCCIIQHKGYHYCDLCEESPEWSTHPKGSRVLWVKAENGYFAAPSLITHYIQVHGYCPPEQFLRAVREFVPDPNWDLYGLRQELCEEARASYRGQINPPSGTS